MREGIEEVAMAIVLTYPTGSALVIGGTGRVGRGVTMRLAEAGLPVVFTYRSSEAEALALECELRDRGLCAVARQMDLGDNDSIDDAIAFAEQWGGPLRTVASAHGAIVPFNRLADFTVEEVEGFFREDALGYFRLVNRAVPVLRRNGGGSLTLCSTYALRRIVTFDGASAFSKGSVEAMVRQIAVEEVHARIRCNAVAIFFTTPDALEEVVAPLPPRWAGADVPPERMLPELLHEVTGHARMGRLNKPDEAGNLYAFLASEQAAYITGQIIAIDGGAGL